MADTPLNGKHNTTPDIDPAETREWMESLDYAVERGGPQRALYLLNELETRAWARGIEIPMQFCTPYGNTIPREREARMPGDPEMERRIRSYIRWNAMAMVVRANTQGVDGIGGHISTYASSATLLEVGFNHFFKGPNHPDGPDAVYFQGHASPGVYARAFIEGRLTERHLENFRRELGEGGGLSSYPHPWLMPDFWQFPTVSMGLGPIMSIYHARFNRYLTHRGIKDASKQRVWAFLGDGETDEPESLGCISLAAREKLDNLTWVINCNLQRLDGPVRGNGKIIQELEGIFRGAGWNVIKVLWSSEWDPLFAADKTGALLKLMMEIPDGQYQKYSGSTGAYVRQDFFNRYPETKRLGEMLSDEQVQRIRRGGHDAQKVFAAYHAAVNHKGQPTVILAKTIKGYGITGGEGQNKAHNQKTLGKDDEERRKLVLDFRTRFSIPLNDEDAAALKFYRPAEESDEMKYLRARREALGGYLPHRNREWPRLTAPELKEFEEFFKPTAEGRDISTTMAYVRILARLLAHKHIGKHIVPIIPDEARTFGMEGLIGKHGIYSSKGQTYEPVDKDQGLMFYKEATDGQILQEGINEAGAMSSFIAAGTSHSVHGVPMIPFYTYYSMFGFQRVGDLIWAAADMRTKGFLIGATSGRTTLNGEGLQHEDGHSHLVATTVPNLLAYDPAFAHEIAVIFQDGIRRMYQDGEDVFYYVTVGNENYHHPGMPEGDPVEIAQGIVRGLYKIKPGPKGKKLHAQLLGCGAILNCALRAQEILAERYGVSANVWSATSYKALRYDAQQAVRWNRLHPTEKPRIPYVAQLLDKEKGPIIAASDYMQLVAEQIAPYLPGEHRFLALGTDGFGRSESRPNLRRFFEVDAENIVLATLYQLAQRGEIDRETVAKAIKDLGLDPEKPWQVLC